MSFWLGKLGACTFISGCVSVFTPGTDRSFAKGAQQIRVQTCPLGTYKAATPACRQLLPGSGEVPQEEVAGRIFSPRHPCRPTGLRASRSPPPLPPISGSRDFQGGPHPAGGAGDSRLPSRSQGPPLEGAQSPEGFLFPEAPRGARGEPKSLGSPNPRPLQEFEPRSCRLGWHVSA